MSVRNETSADAIRARDAALAADHVREPQPRQAAPADSVDRFQQAMQQAQARGDAGEKFDKGRLQQELAQAGQSGDAARADARASEDAVAAVGSEPQRDTASEHDTGLSHQTLEQSDAMAFLQAQMGLRGDGVAIPQQAPAPAANTQAMVDLVERHVRQMAVGGGASAGDGDGQVLLRMADSTLPGTDLLLTRTADGWSLRADSRSRASYDAIREAAPELAKRFAERNLGTLEIDPHYNG